MKPLIILLRAHNGSSNQSVDAVFLQTNPLSRNASFREAMHAAFMRWPVTEGYKSHCATIVDDNKIIEPQH